MTQHFLVKVPNIPERTNILIVYSNYYKYNSSRLIIGIKKPDPSRPGFSGEGGIRTHDTFGIPAFQASALGQTMRPLPYCGQNYTTGWLI
jgi:hypothetical protein